MPGKSNNRSMPTIHNYVVVSLSDNLRMGRYNKRKDFSPQIPNDTVKLPPLMADRPIIQSDSGIDTVTP
ncbi:hypothetical protein J6590_042492 [Homalodisca vitripennis]|nr:hypothetical protein J6590_042492 [Homalodisca vitripennis]